tara:strand:+ start:451 stop:981 length:531 start_codon:yes stop_codon:yes gene_type:complete
MRHIWKNRQSTTNGIFKISCGLFSGNSGGFLCFCPFLNGISTLRRLALLFLLFFSTNTFAEWTSVNGRTIEDNLKSQDRHIGWFLPPINEGEKVILYEIHILREVQHGIDGVIPLHDSYVNVWNIDCATGVNHIDQIRFLYQQNVVHWISTSNSPRPIEKPMLESYDQHSVCHNQD